MRSGPPPGGVWPPFAAAIPLYARFSSSTSRLALSSLSLGSDWGRLVPGYETAGLGGGRSSPVEAQSRKLMRYEKDGPTAGRIALDVPSHLLAAAIGGRGGEARSRRPQTTATASLLILIDGFCQPSTIKTRITTSKTVFSPRMIARPLLISEKWPTLGQPHNSEARPLVESLPTGID